MTEDQCVVGQVSLNQAFHHVAFRMQRRAIHQQSFRGRSGRKLATGSCTTVEGGEKKGRTTVADTVKKLEEGVRDVPDRCRV